MVKRILMGLVGWKLLILLFAFFAVFLLSPNWKVTPSPHFTKNLSYYVWIWGNFDGVHYMDIAEDGYHHFEFPFFPLYPSLIRFLSLKKLVPFFIPYVVSGQIVSNFLFLFSLLLIQKLLILDKRKKISLLFIPVILLYPSSFFYGAVYNDSLFLFLSVVTIYYTRKRLWVLACLAGSLATLCRLNGLALIFVILVEYIFLQNKTISTSWNFSNTKKRIRESLSLKRIVKEKIYAIVFIPFAFLGYLYYVQNIFGSWQLVFSSMSVWNQQRVIFPLQVFWRYFKIIVLRPTFQMNYWVASIEVLFVLLYIGMIIYSYKKIRFSYFVFFVISIIIPSLTGTFQGMPRYGLHLYPFFLSLTLFLSHRSTTFKIVYFVISILLLFICVTLFTRGYFIA